MDYDRIAYNIKTRRGIGQPVNVLCVKDGCVTYSYEQVQVGLGPHNKTIKCKISLDEVD